MRRTEKMKAFLNKLNLERDNKPILSKEERMYLFYLGIDLHQSRSQKD